MRKEAGGRIRTQRKKGIVGLIIGFFVLLGGMLLGGCSLSSSPTSTGALQNSVTPAHSTRATPQQVAEQFCTDMMSAKYTAAYALIAADVRPQLEPQGGSAVLAQADQQATAKYGPSTQCRFLQTVPGASSDQATVTIQVQRTLFQPNQTETDTYEMVREAVGWSVNKWTYDVATK